MCMQRLLEGMFRVRICNEQHENNCVKANFCGVYAIRTVGFNNSGNIHDLYFSHLTYLTLFFYDIWSNRKQS